jgi:transposase
MVTIDKSQISPAGRKLGIKESTAKLIIKRFRETGTIFEKKYVDS